MKKNLVTIILAVAMMFSLCACSIELPEPTCKYDSCEETELYEEGYCKYHYYISVGDTILKDLFN